MSTVTKRQRKTTEASQRKQRRRVFSALACLVVIVTFTALMMPAISMTQDALEQDPAEQSYLEALAASQAGDAAAADAAADVSSAADGQANQAGHGNQASQDNAFANPNDVGADATSEGARGDDATAPETADDQGMPAQTFEEQLKDKDDHITMTVAVVAPQGAFPAGTTMAIKEIPAKDVRDQVEAAIEEAGIPGAVKHLSAVDIVFRNAEGAEIEPAQPVEVKITSPTVAKMDDPLLVHVVDRDKPTQAAKPADAEVVEKVQLVNEDEHDTTVGAEDTLKFQTPSSRRTSSWRRP